MLSRLDRSIETEGVTRETSVDVFGRVARLTRRRPPRNRSLGSVGAKHAKNRTRRCATTRRATPPSSTAYTLCTLCVARALSASNSVASAEHVASSRPDQPRRRRARRRRAGARAPCRRGRARVSRRRCGDVVQLTHEVAHAHREHVEVPRGDAAQVGLGDAADEPGLHGLRVWQPGARQRQPTPPGALPRRAARRRRAR